MQAYSPELRRDVLAADEAGASTHQIAIEFNVSKSWVRRVKQEFREQGKTAPKATRDRPTAWQRHADWITAKVEAQPDIYLHELQAAAEAELGWTTCDMTFVRALRTLGLTRKKDPDRRRAGVGASASGPRGVVGRSARARSRPRAVPG